MALSLSLHTSFSDWPRPVWDATGGSHWGPLGYEPQWASFCPLCQILLFPLHSQGLGRWELGFPLLSQACFFIPLSFWGQGPQSVSRTQPVKCSQPFRTQGYLNTGGFLYSQGRGQQAKGKASSFGNWHQWNPKPCDLTFWHVQHYPTGPRVKGELVDFYFRGSSVRLASYIYRGLPLPVVLRPGRNWRAK